MKCKNRYKEQETKTEKNDNDRKDSLHGERSGLTTQLRAACKC